MFRLELLRKWRMKTRRGFDRCSDATRRRANFTFRISRASPAVLLYLPTPMRLLGRRSGPTTEATPSQKAPSPATLVKMRLSTAAIPTASARGNSRIIGSISSSAACRSRRRRLPLIPLQPPTPRFPTSRRSSDRKPIPRMECLSAAAASPRRRRPPRMQPFRLSPRELQASYPAISLPLRCRLWPKRKPTR